MKPSTHFAALLERFFTQRLMQQRQASAHTIASYRDTFKMLLQYAHKQLHKPPSSIALADMDAPLIAAFLDDLESTRGVTARTRNLRLTAVHSFFRFASYEAPDHAAQIERVLGSVHSIGFVFTSWNLDVSNGSGHVERCTVGADFGVVAREAHGQGRACRG
ncbi:hypothetical protein B9N43_07190 [Denitratisoma sp. DHT3]|uniref:site-specific integrase n=1 Tax=Denitratisoma sp. DHT3 TaxID=1981880 RepID=UPI0011988E5D|nr:site-specific integrase [Denitratisoma sp. DHT3]QDX81047.1 hypothetical protein B9N43_07190 [Denitratisoma sp. DHT3]